MRLTSPPARQQTLRACHPREPGRSARLPAPATYATGQAVLRRRGNGDPAVAEAVEKMLDQVGETGDTTHRMGMRTGELMPSTLLRPGVRRPRCKQARASTRYSNRSSRKSLLL